MHSPMPARYQSQGGLHLVHLVYRAQFNAQILANGQHLVGMIYPRQPRLSYADQVLSICHDLGPISRHDTGVLDANRR